MSYHYAAEIEIPEESWEETGNNKDPRARLYVSALINGIGHHLEAFAVMAGEDGIQEPAHAMWGSNLEGIAIVAEPDGPWQTVEISGRNYVITMTPFC